MGEKISALNTDLLIKSEHNKKGGQHIKKKKALRQCTGICHEVFVFRWERKFRLVFFVENTFF